MDKERRLTTVEDFETRVAHLFSALEGIRIDDKISLVIDSREVFALGHIDDGDLVGVGFGWMSGEEGREALREQRRGMN